MVMLTAGFAAAATASKPIPEPPVGKLAPSGIATVDDYLPDIIASLGLRPEASVSTLPTGWLPAFQPYSKGVVNLGEDPTATSSLELLATTHPKLIISPAAYESTIGPELSAIAPTIYYDTTPLPFVTSSGQVASDWKLFLYQVASQIGRDKQADEVVAHMATRAAAISGQTAGKTLAYVRLDSASTWKTGNNYLPVAQVFVQDLGLKNFQLPSSDYSSGCGLNANPPQGCQSSDLSEEELPTLSSASAVLVQDNALGSSDISTFETNPLFANLPAVKSGHVAEGAFFTRVGPLGVAYEYSAIVQALGLREYYAQLPVGTTSSGTTTNVSFTVNPSTSRFCWAVQPANGTKPPVALTLSYLSGGKVLVRTLSKSPQYSEIPSSLSSVGIETPSDPQYLASGCMSSPALAKWLASSPSSVRVQFGTGQTTTHSGVPPVIG
jgi:ABC-type Fe3+-hydroxamate transport system substrate-binding protein